MNAEQVKARQAICGGPQGGMSKQGVAVERDELEPDGRSEQYGVDLAKIRYGIAKRRDERQDEEIEDDGKKHPPQGFQH